MQAWCITCERMEAVMIGNSIKPSCAIHFIDSRRAMGQTFGGDRQYPVICARDFVTVRANAYRLGATSDWSRVTCKDCLSRR